MKKLLIIQAATVLIFSLLFLSCKRESPTDKELQSAGYPDEIGKIILTSCANPACHEGPNAPESLDLSTWEKMYEGSDFGAIMIPFSPDWSHLFQHTNTFEDLGIRATPVMPPDSADGLSRTTILELKDWIESGAKNRLGELFWATEEAGSGGKMFTLCAGSDLVAVTDLKSNLIMRMFEVGQQPGSLEAPHYITLSPDQQFIYLTLIEGGLVEKYRTDNYEFVSRVAVGATPALIHLNSDGTRAIVTHWNASGAAPKATMLNTTDMTIIEQIKAGGDFISFPHGVEVTDDFSKVYIAANEGNYVSVLDIDMNGFLNEEKFPVDPDNSPVPFATNTYKPYQLYLTADESKLFVSCNATNEVRVFDTQDNSLIATIPVGAGPRLMAYDPISDQLFVACRNEENFSEQGSLQGCVSVIDVGNLSFVKNIYRVGHRPHGVGVDISGKRLFISSENTGGVDELHHPLEGNTQPPGKYNVVNIETLTVLSDEETEVAEFPNALVITD